MPGFLAIGPLALRRAMSRWRLLVPLLLGAILAVALLSSTFIYGDSVRQLGLDRTFLGHEREELDLNIVSYYAPTGESAYATIRSEVDTTILRNVSWFVEDSARAMESSTFFINDQATEGQPIDSSPERIASEELREANPRLRTFLFFQSDFFDNATLVAGAIPDEVSVRIDSDNRPLTAPEIPVLIFDESAREKGLSVGDRFLLVPHWEDISTHTIARISGIVRRTDPSARFWQTDLHKYVVRTEAQNFIPMIVSEQTYMEGLGRLFPSMLSDYSWALFVDPSKIDVTNVDLAQFGLSRMNNQLRNRLDNFYRTSTLDAALADFNTRDLFGRVPLLIIVMMVMGIVIYYLVMVANVVADRHLSEVALLRSRGADSSQVLILYLWEALGIAVIAFFIGPFLAVGATSLMGLTPAFSAVTNGDPLPVRLSGNAVGMALGGAAIAFGAMLLPTLKAIRLNPLRHRTEQARPETDSFFQRYYVDVFLGILAGILFWELTQRGTVVSDSFAGERKLDQALLAAPALFLLAIGLLLMRFFPVVMRAAGWGASAFRRAWLVLGFWQMARNPLPYTRPILLLMLAASVAMFAANFGATLDRSYEDRAQYASGGDLLFQGASLPRRGQSVSFAENFSVVQDAQAWSPALRARAGRALQIFSSTRFTVLGVEPESFRQVAWYRDDFSSKSLDGLLQTLEAGPAMGQGIPLPEEASTIGVWARMATPRNDIELRARIRDVNGRHANFSLGNVGNEWSLLESDLAPTGRFASLSLQLKPPLELLSLTIQQRGGMTLLPGAIYLDDVQASREDGSIIAVVESFDDRQGMTVIQDTPNATGDSLEVSETVVRAANNPVGVFIWGPGSLGAPRGLLLGSEANPRNQPLPAIASRSALSAADLSRGDVLLLSISGHIVPVRIAEVVDFFPTLNPYERGFLVLDLDSLLQRINGPETISDWQPNEVWVASGMDGPSRQEFITMVQDTSGLRATDRLQLEAAFEADPLTAAGWRGALNIAFFSVIFATLMGFGVYAYSQAQERRVEFALLRGMGLSWKGLAGIVLVEQTIVITLGLGLGSWIGFQLTSLLMPFLDLTEEGTRVLPPFAARVSWPAILTTYGIIAAVFLGATIGLIAYFSKFGIQRALRIGEP